MPNRFVCALLLFIAATPVSLAQTKAPVRSLRDPGVEVQLVSKLAAQPSISMTELAAFGNRLIATRGFDYGVESCRVIGRVTAKEKKPTDALLRRRTSLIGLDGKSKTFEVDVTDPANGLCGECDVHIPAFKFNQRELVLAIDGKLERYKRPADFGTEDAFLVDSSMKKVLRKWTMPHQTIPSAISADGTKLYIEFYSPELDKLFIELSEDGRIQLVPAADIKMSSEPESIDDSPTDPKNDYLSFLRYRVGGNTYIVRFSAPCT